MSKLMPQDAEARRHDMAIDAAPINERRGPLAELVGAYLKNNGLRQVDFCRRTGFDQGLLSKILSSVVTTLNVETALRLAAAMEVPPVVVFEAIGKKELDDLLRRFYAVGATADGGAA